MSSTSTLPTSTKPPWDLAWLTPIRCRLILLTVLALGFFSHVYYLNHNCPVDLSGDEAQYWDWSRNLDLSYYSKGPLVAYIIRASCEIFGNTMPAVRYPALVFSVATSIVTYLLTKKLFASEKLALGAVLLFHIVPMFIAGSVLMTIDPPMFFCWALATYFAAIAIFDDRKSMWIFVGITIGIGFLAKYATFLWFAGLFGYLLRSHGRKSVVLLIAPIIAMLFTLPVIIWNSQHHWVSLRHVAKQTGAADGEFSALNPINFLLSQIAVIGPTLIVIMIAATFYAVRRRFNQTDPNRDRMLFLAWIGLPFLFFNLLASIRAKVQGNWPAPAYFSLTILTAYFLATRLRSIETWKPWRGWFYASIVIGLLIIPLAHDTSIILPIVEPIVSRLNRPLIANGKPPKYNVNEFDFLERLRGWRQLGDEVSMRLHSLRPGAFVLCDDYQQTAEMAFYVAGQPKTYCAGPYFGKRLSQYDMWPDRRLDASPPLVGRDAIYVGKGGSIPSEVAHAFDRVERLPFLPIYVRGLELKTFKFWRCTGFKGMSPPSGLPDY